MVNVIIPIDFSETSFNAAHFGTAMYAKRADINIILYHFYETEEDSKIASTYLNNLKVELNNKVSNIEIITESGDNFIDSLTAYAQIKTAYMIIMGLTGKSEFKQFFLGSNTLKMAEKAVCPILIIPPDALYTKMINVVIASEMKYVDETPVLLAAKRVLADFKPKLHILNVNSNHYISLTTSYKEERDKMDYLLAEFQPEFYFMRLFDFHESINLFVEDYNIDLLIIGPKHHTIFEKIFKTQHTKKMIYQSKIPVLAVHE